MTDPDMAMASVQLGKEPHTLKGMLSELAQVTGVQKASNTRHKVFWSVILVIGILMIIMTLAGPLQRYVTYPKNSEMSVILADQLDFPAVTLCNLNPIRASQLVRLAADDQFRQLIENEVQDLANFTTIKVRDRYREEIQMTSPPDEVTFHDQYLALYAELNTQDRDVMGHSMHDMLISCTYGGYRCSPNNFTMFPEPRHGNCYTFNLNGTLTADEVGPMHGLVLEMSVEQDEYITALTQTAGLRVIVHDQNAMPFPELQGINVSPGTHADIRIKQRNMERLSAPYGICQDHKDVSKKTQISSRDNVEYYTKYYMEYNSLECTKTCYQKSVIDACGCYDASLPIGVSLSAFLDVNSTEKNSKPCTDKATIDRTKPCQDQVKVRSQMHDLECSSHCPTQCRSTEYTMSLTTSALSSNVAKTGVMRKLMAQSVDLNTKLVAADETQREAYVRDNFIKLEVYYNDLAYNVIMDMVSYTLAELLYDLGITFLWLVVSVIALFEILDVCCFRRATQKINP